MTLLKKLLWSSLFSILIITNALAAQTFVIRNIQVQGLQGISKATVLNYLPVHVGETFDPSKTDEIINDLYQTGFFSNISLARAGNTLIINVSERPVIGSIKVTGNNMITKDQINGVLSNVGLVEGRVFDQSVLNKLTNSLQSEYYSIGHYNARVTTTVTPEPRNRVAVLVTVSEGRVALVEHIQIIGNTAFSSSAIIHAMTLTTPKWNTFFTQSDHYSKDKLDASMDGIRNYYLDRGYLKIKIDSYQASIAPDRKSIFLIVHLTEGPIYYVSGYDIVGNLILPKAKLESMVKLKPGDPFSRAEIVDATKRMMRALGNQGYAFADVNAIPTIDETTRRIFISFHVNPGNRIYVRRVNFAGNTKTADYVLRRAMRVQEGGMINLDDIDESTRNLNMLGYLGNVKETTNPVVGTNDQVDVDYNVTEKSSAAATAGAGYGTDGFVLSAGINESNFLGTGDSVGINFNSDPYERTYSFSFNNPCINQYCVSRGFTVYDTLTTPFAVNLGSFYSTNEYGFNVAYGIPISEYDSYQLGYGVQHTTLHNGNESTVENGVVVPIGSTMVQSFIKDNGNEFNQLLLSLGWTRDTLDRAVFPTSGLNQAAAIQISTPIASTPLDYYKLTYQAHWFLPMWDDYIFTAEGGAGYGNSYGSPGALPFFDNYYAGGIGFNGAVRGYETNTLGPQDNTGTPVGGNAMLAGSLGLIIPTPIDDTLRTTLFVDAGNVFDTKRAYNVPFESPSVPTPGAPQTNNFPVGIDLGELRYSTGVEFDWQVPVVNALLTLSFAKALNPSKTDQTEWFQFNIGTSF